MDVGNIDASVSSKQGVSATAIETLAAGTACIPLRPSAPARRQLSTDEWATLRPLIEQLYIKERKTFPEVRDILRDEHKFEPTKRQFVGVVMKWGLKKNTNQKQRQLILEKLNEDQYAKEVGTFTINQRKLRRWKKKDVSPATDPIAGTVARATNLSRQLASPITFQLSENMFTSINIFVTGSIESRSWVTSQEGPCFNVVRHGSQTPDVSYLDTFHANCVNSTEFIKKNSFVEARKCLSNACSLMRQILENEDPDAILYFVMSFWNMRGNNRLDILDEALNAVRSYLGKLAFALLPAGHPWRNICCLLASIELEQIDEVLPLIMECMATVLEAKLGRFHETTFQYIMEVIGNLKYPNDLKRVEIALRELVVELQQRFDLSKQLFYILERLCGNLRKQKRYAEAEIEAKEYLILARAAKSEHKIVNSLMHLAQAQYSQDKREGAEMTLRECAATVLAVKTGDSVSWAILFLTRLERWLREWGRDADADTLREEIASMIVEPPDVIEEVDALH